MTSLAPFSIRPALRRLACSCFAVLLAAGTASAQERLPLSLTKVDFAPHVTLHDTPHDTVDLDPHLTGVQTSEAELIDRLHRRGFEDVRVLALGDSLYLSFEYRMARGSHAGACEALTVVGAGFQHVVAVLEHQEVPMTSLSFVGPVPTPVQLTDRGPGVPASAALPPAGSCAGYRIVDATHEVGPTVRRLREGRHRPSRFIDLAIHPRYSALFGFYRDPLMLQINLAPRINVRLWDGFEIGAQAIIPLHNEFSSEGDHIRPGLLTASQFVRLPNNTFVRASVGSFTNRRFGVDVRARRLFDDGRTWAGLDVGRTGNLYYPNGSIFVERDPEWLVLASAGFAWPRHNMSVDVAAGRFLFGDVGGRLEIMRQFRKTDIGFFYAQTVNGANAGLRLILPLFEGTFAGSRSLRVRPAPDFTWDYMYRAGLNAGEYYDTGYYMDRMYRQHQPDFLMHLLSTP